MRRTETKLSSSRLILGGRVRCTATVSTSVRAGSPLGLSFVVRNISNRTVRVSLSPGGLWLVVSAADGTTYDTRAPLRNEIGLLGGLTAIPPRGTETTSLIGKYLPVRWSGPLRITPGCGQTALPVMQVSVRAAGSPSSDRSAIATVVASSGHLLDHCRPQRPGVPVEGKIYAPKGDAPPMRATCSVSIDRLRGFLVAQILILVPPNVQGVRVRQPYEQLSFTNPTPSPYEAIAWQFVVTRHGATPVSAAEALATKPANRMAPDWNWTSTGPGRPGDDRCGASGGGFGGTSPLIEFISVCPS